MGVKGIMFSLIKRESHLSRSVVMKVTLNLTQGIFTPLLSKGRLWKDNKLWVYLCGPVQASHCSVS